ncbi:MAG: Extracellular ligand-binding receptor [Parcubacteria group bacterium]|nr:Extracellular ligand-binding receptor [Parcubacteria group bacterium]
MKTKNIFLTVFIVVIIGFAFWLLAGKSKLSDNLPVKIGASEPLTGKFASLGEPRAKAMRMAADEINNNGGINGKKLEFVIEDNQGEAKVAATNASKLLNIDNVDVVVTGFTHITNAIKSLVAEKNKVMLYASTVRDIAESNKLFFRDYWDAIDSGKALAKAIGNDGYKKVAFLSEISDQCNQIEQTIKEDGQKYSFEIIATESYNPTDLDLRTNLAKIKASKPEAIVACSWRHENILMRQLNELGMLGIKTYHIVAPFIASSDTKENRELFEKNGAVSTWYGVAEAGIGDKQKEFIEKYQNRYGVKPTSEAIYVYDNVYILAESLRKCDKVSKVRDSNCIADNLLKTDFDGIGGKLSFDKNGVSTRKVTMIKIINGLWTEMPFE